MDFTASAVSYSRHASESTSSLARPTWAAYLQLGIEDGDKIDGRRKSVECASVRVVIDRTELTRDSPDSSTYSSYVITVICGNHTWIVRRRYSDFTFLHSHLEKLHSSLPSLPPKRYFGSSTDYAFVEDRRVKLEGYLNNLIAMPAIWKSPLLATFLDGGQNTLIYLWNFERMKKMQKIITSMSMESQGKTDVLTHELVEAREQVKTLQERINRMEMLFLQSAAGVATQAITPEKLRAISTSGGPKLPNSTSNSDLASEGMDSIQDRVPFFEDEIKPPQLEPEQVVEVLNMTKSIAEIVDKTEQLQMTRSDRKSESARSSSVEKQLKRNLSNDLRLLSRDNDKAFALSVQLQKAVEISNTILEDPYTITKGRASKDASSPPCIRSGPESCHKSDSLESLPSITVVTNPAEVMLRFGEEASKDDLWVGRLFGRVDELITALAPTKESIDDRLAVYQYIRGIVSQFLGVEVAPVGSFVSRTFLLEGDLDLTVIMPRNMDTNSWFVRLNEALCLAAMGSQNLKPNDRHNLMRMIVNSVSFINAEVKIIKTTINNIAIDISGNQIASIYAQEFIEKIDSFIGKSHLFKRSMILIKAWCQYEANRFANTPLLGGAVLGARDGRLSSWSVLIMGVWLFNCQSDEISHPLKALVLFLKYYKDFDWINFALTACGPVSIADLSPLESTAAMKKHIPHEIIIDTFKRFNAMRRGEPRTDDGSRGLSSSAPAAISVEDMIDYQFASEYRRSVMNIIDPVKGNCNVSSSVDVSGYQFIQRAFEGGYAAVLDLLKQCSECPIPDESLQLNAATKNLDVPIVKQFFNQTTAELKLAGRGRIVSKTPEDYDPYGTAAAEIESWLTHVESLFVKTIPRDSLCAVVYHILASKGPVPVGEIGKCLQSMTNNNDLMPTIKLEYKGLKKFIEMFPEYFSVGTEHPFNPLVYLNSTGAKPILVDDITNVLMSLTPAGYSQLNSPMQDAATTPSSSSSDYTIFEAPKNVFMHASSLPNDGLYRMNTSGNSNQYKMGGGGGAGSGGGDGHQFQPLRKGNSFKEHKSSSQQQGYDQNRRKGGSFTHSVPIRDDIYVQQHAMPPVMPQANVNYRRPYPQPPMAMNYREPPLPSAGSYRMSSQPRLSDSLASTTASTDSIGLEHIGSQVAVSVDNPAGHQGHGFTNYHDPAHGPEYITNAPAAAPAPLAMHQMGQVVYFEAVTPKRQTNGFVNPEYYGAPQPSMHPQSLPMGVGSVTVPGPAAPHSLQQARPPNSPPPGHNGGVPYFYSSS